MVERVGTRVAVAACHGARIVIVYSFDPILLYFMRKHQTKSSVQILLNRVEWKVRMTFGTVN